MLKIGVAAAVAALIWRIGSRELGGWSRLHRRTGVGVVGGRLLYLVSLFFTIDNSERIKRHPATYRQVPPRKQCWCYNNRQHQPPDPILRLCPSNFGTSALVPLVLPLLLLFLLLCLQTFSPARIGSGV